MGHTVRVGGPSTPYHKHIPYSRQGRAEKGDVTGEAEGLGVIGFLARLLREDVAGFISEVYWL